MSATGSLPALSGPTTTPTRGDCATPARRTLRREGDRRRGGAPDAATPFAARLVLVRRDDAEVGRFWSAAGAARRPGGPVPPIILRSPPAPARKRGSIWKRADDYLIKPFGSRADPARVGRNRTSAAAGTEAAFAARSSRLRGYARANNGCVWPWMPRGGTWEVEPAKPRRIAGPRKSGRSTGAGSQAIQPLTKAGDRTIHPDDRSGVEQVIPGRRAAGRESSRSNGGRTRRATLRGGCWRGAARCWTPTAGRPLSGHRDDITRAGGPEAALRLRSPPSKQPPNTILITDRTGKIEWG